jgi:RHS repeat-associated protein
LISNIYGSSRVGIKNTNKRVTALAYNIQGSSDIIIPETINPLDPVKRSLGEKQYELSNHLGNVLVTVSDRKLAEGTEGSTATGYRAEVLFASDYYPFGMQMPGREFSQEEYRYGFNGMEKDDELAGEGNSYTAQFWQYDSRLGRRWNTDPVVKDWESPYATFRGNPIWYVDPDGDDPSTQVDENEDGTYTVVGGDQNDGDNGIYIKNEDGTNGELIGYSVTPESFLRTDMEDPTWMGTIDPNDQSGKSFLNMVMEEQELLSYIVDKGRGFHEWDFKRSNGTDGVEYTEPVDFYRGMPLMGTYNGKQIFGSARDVGNIGAGYIAAINGMRWEWSRAAFDAYQSESETSGTQLAQRVGFVIGYILATNYQSIHFKGLPSYGEVGDPQPMPKSVIINSDRQEILIYDGE